MMETMIHRFLKMPQNSMAGWIHTHTCTHNIQLMKTKEDILKTDRKKLNTFCFQRRKTVADFSTKTI